MSRLTAFLPIPLIALFFLCGAAAAGQITVGDISLNPDGSATTTITLDQAPHGLLGYKIGLKVPDSSVAEVISVIYPSGFTLTDTTPAPFTNGSIKAMDLYGIYVPAGSVNIPLATVTMHGRSSGSTTLHATVMLIQDLDGEYFDPSPSVVDGKITVVGPHSGAGLLLVPLKMDGGVNNPTDPDHDGLCDDLNGDGSTDINDVKLYFYNFNWIEQNEPVSLFDFNGNGRIDFGDIISLNQKC